MVEALHRIFHKEGLDCTEWTADDTFGAYPFTDLLAKASESHYAVCVLWPDDELKSKPKQKEKYLTRDNVVFEAGLFAGVLAPDLWKGNVKLEKRVFIWVNTQHHDLHIPTDLAGLHQERYNFSGDLASKETLNKRHYCRRSMR